MSNLRIISDNAADRAILAASSTAGGLAVTNLLNDAKGTPWRAGASAANLFVNNSADTANGWSLGPNMTRVGITTAPDGTNTAVVYTTAGNSNAFVGNSVALAANTCYRTRVWVRLVSGQVPTSGSAVISYHDSDGVSASPEVTGLGWPVAGLSTAWKRVELTFYNLAAGFYGQYLCTDFANGAQIALWDAQLTVAPLTARLDASWSMSELIGAAFLPFCNLSPTATMRVRLSNESSDANLETYSGVFSPGIWSFTEAFPVPNVVSIPDGSLTGYKFVESATASAQHEMYRGTGITGGQQYTASILLRAGERTKARFGFVLAGFSLGATAIFDLAAGTKSAVTHYGSSAGATATMTALGGGWYRCSVTITPAASAMWYVALDLVIGTSTVSYTGDGSSGLYMTAAQLETGPPSSYYPSLDTFTSRAGTATFIGSNGLMQTAAVNVARMQYNPLNLAAPPKLLLEVAAGNLLKQSGTLSNASWGKQNIAVTAGAALAPDGTMTMEMLSGVAAVTSYIYQTVTGLTAGANYAVSAYFRKGSSATTFLRIFDGALSGLVARCQIDWPTSGAPTFSNVAGTWATLPYLMDCGGGLYRVCGAVNTAALTALSVLVYPDGVNNGVLTVYATAFQLQAGLYADSYIPTTTAAVARNADLSTSAPGVRPAGYIDAWQSYDYDSGAVPACPAAAVKLRGFTAAQAASAYAYGGGACARHWLPAQMPALGMAIDIADPANLQGYIEAARLVVGAYWSPINNPDYGASMAIQDASKHYRTDAGDLLTDIGTRARKLPLNLSAMPPSDRTALVSIIRSNGMAGPMLVSLFPGDADLELERDHTIYGKLSSISAMALPFYGAYAMPLEIEEV